MSTNDPFGPPLSRRELRLQHESSELPWTQDPTPAPLVSELPWTQGTTQAPPEPEIPAAWKTPAPEQEPLAQLFASEPETLPEPPRYTPEPQVYTPEPLPVPPLDEPAADVFPAAAPEPLIPESFISESVAYAPEPQVFTSDPQYFTPSTQPTMAPPAQSTPPAPPTPPAAQAPPVQERTPAQPDVPTALGTLGFVELLAQAQRMRASDVHLTEHLPPQVRVDGDLTFVPGAEAPLSDEWFEIALRRMLSQRQYDELESSDEIDLSVQIEGVARFRVNVFKQLGRLAIALRFISEEALPLEKLGVPDIAAELVLRPRGLVLITGPTGSGKSTTLASMIDLVNRRLPSHIVTIEDPIEFRHTSKKALVHQREVGSDTRSFAEAMRRVLRQDPDIILIGELRDPESISTALTAAETGHLVLSTLHTQSAAKSINRIVDAFPPEQQAQVRTQLGDALQGIITQTLLPKASGQGRVIGTEVLVNTPAIANLIREGDVSQIYSMMQAGRSLGMHTLDQDLTRLVDTAEITLELAQSRAQDPKSIADGVDVRSGLQEENWMNEMGNQQANGWVG